MGVTDQEITIAFYQRLEQEGLDPSYPHYVAFTNAHWERFKAIQESFCAEHNLSYYDNARAIQAGVHMYIAHE